MNQVFHARLLLLISMALLMPAAVSGQIDLGNLDEYANQPIPNYIGHDNTPGFNPITDEGATLGRVLFYDKLLSIDNSVSCATCHQQENAFSDLDARSVGINGILTARHSMRLVNMRFTQGNLVRWDETATLEQQMTIPIREETEMGYSGENGNPSFEDLLQLMSATSYYPVLFEAAFGDPNITENRMRLAMAQFVRSIQSFDAKYDAGRALVESDAEDFPNFTPQENAGKNLFMQNFDWVEDEIEVDGAPGNPGGIFPAARRVSGGLNCAACHSPPEFDIAANSLNNGFVRASPPAPGAPLDVTVFRSPTLRDMIKPDGVTLNGGLFHSGLANNINIVLAHYEFRRLEPDNPFLDPRMTRNGLPQWLDITNNERQSVIAFLRTLSGSDIYTNEKWSDPFDAEGNLEIIQDFLLGDANLDGEVNLLDVAPLVDLISFGPFLAEADINLDGEINLLDVEPFIDLLTGN